MTLHDMASVKVLARAEPSICLSRLHDIVGQELWQGSWRELHILSRPPVRRCRVV
jgi:hypothetical protein